MIDAGYVRTMARYNSWQNSQLRPVIEAMSHKDLVKDRGAFFGSILATANHLLWGDTLWMSRFDPSVEPPSPDVRHDELHPTGAAWAADRFRMDGKIRHWANSLRSVDLKGDMTWYSVMLKQHMSARIDLAVVGTANPDHLAAVVAAARRKLGADA